MIYLGSIVILISVSTLMFHYLLFVLGLFRFALNLFFFVLGFYYFIFFVFLVCLFVCLFVFLSAWIKWDMIFFSVIYVWPFKLPWLSRVYSIFSCSMTRFCLVWVRHTCVYLCLFWVSGRFFLHLLDKCQVPGIFRY
jgi:hypothetical protein